jgi:hypothetical protein
MVRAVHLLCPLLPALGLVVWASRAHPTTVAFGGMFVFVLTLVLGGLGGVVTAIRANIPATMSWAEAAPIVAFGGAATGWYWFRAWHYPGPEQWELAGVPVLAYTLLAFWWPGVFVAEISWILRAILRTNGASAGPMLLVGLLAGVLGAIGGKVASGAYYARVERVPLAVRLVQIAQPTAGQIEHQLDQRRLVVELGTHLDRKPAYTALQAAQAILEGGRDLLRRKDVEQVTLVLRVATGELLRYQATRAERQAPVWDRTQLRRERLSGSGRLAPDSLRPMVQAPLWYPEHQDVFTYTVDGEAVRVAYLGADTAAADTMELQAAAWASANKIVNEVVRFFPEIRRFEISLPGLSAEIAAADVRPGSFRLQHRLLSSDQVVVLHVTQGEPRESFDPARFFAHHSAAGFQVAVLREHFQTPYHLVGSLHEEIRLLPGLLYVTRVAPDGTATCFMGEPTLEGPIEIGPRSRAVVGSDTVVNLGWFARSRFVRSADGSPR